MQERPTQPRGDDVNLRSAPQLREYHAMVERIAADAPASILDWGCGLGQVSALLLDAGLNVSSFDYRGEGSPDAVVAMPLFPQVRAHISSDPRRLPYEDASFDAVLSCGVLEHVLDPEASLDELARILRPRGTLYVYKLPNRFSYLEKLAKRMGLYYHGAEPHELLYTPASARALLERHGYEIGELRLANMLPLTLDVPVAQRPRVAAAVWAANRALARVPGLNRVATNVELVARAPAT
jgi:ubiquinone/menaquinone biosynthesis C-methylase UbiE